MIDELAFEPMLDAATIGISAKGGVITLNGTVRNYPEKYAAEQAAKRVGGLHGIALVALESDISVPKNKVTVKVESGWLTIEGVLDWHYQR